uniref:Neur_chan_memb domain-containing protein n=1 Tax=Strongyloides papillosus TaxID=174720 RepID=A0A0N5CE23_STREA
MRRYIFTNILIFLIIPNLLVNCLVLYHRVPKPRLICHEEVLDNTTHGGVYRSKNHNKQMPIIPEEDSSSGMHIEHVRHRRQQENKGSEEEGPILEIDVS